MAAEITKRVLIVAMLMGMGTGHASNSIDPVEAFTRVSGVVLSAVAGNWAWYRLKACLVDLKAGRAAKDSSEYISRVNPTFAEDLQNIGLTGACASGLLLAGLGWGPTTKHLLQAVAVETVIMGGTYLSGKYLMGFEDMRLRHAMEFTLGIGLARQAAVRFDAPHFSFGAPVSRVICENL